MTAGTLTSTPRSRPERRPLMAFVRRNRRAFSALLIFLVLLAIFTILNPKVFTNAITYRAIFLSLPISLFVVVPMVFIVASGEIDLSFPATVGITSWVFSAAVRSGWEPFAALVPALLLGMLIGVVVGSLVTYVGLSSLVATLGMNFLLRGIINMGTEGVAIQFPQMRSTTLWQVFAGRIDGFPIIDDFPIHMIWGVLFVALGWVLFNRHKFGTQVQIVGDNPDSATEMGINVFRVKIAAYVFMGIGATLAGVLSVLVNQNWWPTTGDGLLLPTLAAVFVGGTPTWGGIGTVVGSSIGAFIIAFIETGIIAAGLTGYVTQFFNGLVIIVSLIGHRFNGPRYR
ncbi:MAG: ABC transporter permease [Chloroflexi bacterium]|nr:ABC transporter permease [Chloroflexota bacterium]